MGHELRSSESTVAGRYRIESRLGRGGMADVYAAHDTLLDRRVAIKLLREAPDSETARARFVSEARILAGTSDPGLVKVLDAGITGDRPYLVMELLPGGTVADLVDRGSQPLDRVAEIGAQAASALVPVHAAGIVHRDIKPGNLLFDGQGRAPSRRLRHRPPGRGHGPGHRDRHDHRHGHLPGAGAGLRWRGRHGCRCLRPGAGPARADHRGARLRRDAHRGRPGPPDARPRRTRRPARAPREAARRHDLARAAGAAHRGRGRRAARTGEPQPGCGAGGPGGHRHPGRAHRGPAPAWWRRRSVRAGALAGAAAVVALGLAIGLPDGGAPADARRVPAPGPAAAASVLPAEPSVAASARRPAGGRGRSGRARFQGEASQAEAPQAEAPRPQAAQAEAPQAAEAPRAQATTRLEPCPSTSRSSAGPSRRPRRIRGDRGPGPRLRRGHRRRRTTGDRRRRRSRS